MKHPLPKACIIAGLERAARDTLMPPKSREVAASAAQRLQPVNAICFQARGGEADCTHALDPELIVDGIQLAIFHMGMGAESYGAVSRALMADMREEGVPARCVRPYLRAWFTGAYGVASIANTPPLD